MTALVVALPLLAVGLAAGLDDAPGLGATLAAVGVFCVLSVTVALRRRYGPDGSRWQGRLEEAAGADNDWHEVEVWFVRPSLQENERSQRIALVAEPNARPHLASKLLVTSGAGLHPGRARLWSPTGPGHPALLEKDGHALWPSRPAQGRVGVMLARIAAAIPLSTSVLERPES